MRGRRIIFPVIAVAVLTSSLWSFVSIMNAVRAGRTQAWDEYVLSSMRAGDDAQNPVGPRRLQHAIRDITALGSMPVVILMTAVMIGYFLLVRQRQDALLLALAVTTGITAYSLVKNLIARERPAEWSPLVYTESHSFPSGHVTLATLFYFGLALLVCRHARTHRVRVFVWSAAIALAILVAFSRVYLGIHWPSDVLAGLLAGIAWTALWWLVGWAMELRIRPKSLPMIPAAPPIGNETTPFEAREDNAMDG